jgi:hypothetical protein
MPQITRQSAEIICKKLGAVFIQASRNSDHDIYGVYFEDRLVGKVGISRSPRKDKGHGHIPRDLFVRSRFAWEIASCKWYLEDYLRERGLIASPPEAPELSEPKAVAELPDSTQESE